MDNYPDDLAPDFEDSGAVATPFHEWWARVQGRFPNVPEEVARDWLHRHWSHSPFGWLPSANYQFQLAEWPREQIDQIRTGWTDFSPDPAGAVEHGRYLVVDCRKILGGPGLIGFMTANRTFPVPPVVLDNRDDHIRLLREAPLPYPASFLLVEGHRRFNIAAYLAQERLLRPAVPIWVMSRSSGL